MLKLYAVPVSLYCAKLRIVLRHKKLEWEEVLPPGGYGSASYKQLVPAGNLPALDHAGLVLGDSEVIAEYLNEVFPEPQMLPGGAAERAAIRALSRFHDTRLEPAVRALFPHIADKTRDVASIERLWSALQERLGQLEPLLHGGEKALTLGDCGYPITLSWVQALANHFDQPFMMSEGLQSYRDRILVHDAVAAELSAYQPRLSRWLSEK